MITIIIISLRVYKIVNITQVLLLLEECSLGYERNAQSNRFSHTNKFSKDFMFRANK